MDEMDVGTIDRVSYGKLLAKTLPKVIETDEENERMIAELKGLDSLPKQTPEQKWSCPQN